MRSPHQPRRNRLIEARAFGNPFRDLLAIKPIIRADFEVRNLVPPAQAVQRGPANAEIPANFQRRQNLVIEHGETSMRAWKGLGRQVDIGWGECVRVYL